MMLFDESFGSENEHFESMRMHISLDRDFTKRTWETLPRKKVSNLQKTGIALNSIYIYYTRVCVCACAILLLPV